MIIIPKPFVKSAKCCTSHCHYLLYFSIYSCIIWYGTPKLGEFWDRVEFVSIQHNVLRFGFWRVWLIQYNGFSTLIFRPNFFEASDKAFINRWIPWDECESSALSSAKSSSLTSKSGLRFCSKVWDIEQVNILSWLDISAFIYVSECFFKRCWI